MQVILALTDGDGLHLLPPFQREATPPVQVGVPWPSVAFVQKLGGATFFCTTEKIISNCGSMAN